MKTIKEKVLTAISKKGTMPRKEVTFEVLKANGTLKDDYQTYLEEYSHKFRGYYSINYQQWELEGIITRKKGVYSITKLGKQYLKNPSIIRQINKDRRQKREVRNENMRRHFVIDAIGYFQAVGLNHLSMDEQYYVQILLNLAKKHYL